MRHNYIYILLTYFICLYISDVTSSWVLTSTVWEEFEDGSQKKCEIDNTENIICSTSWRNGIPNNGVLEDLDGKCKYFRKTTIYKCEKDYNGW